MLDELRTRNEFFSRSQALSISIHVAVLGLLLIPFATQMRLHFAVPGVWIPTGPVKEPPLDFLRRISAPEPGGGQREAGEATRGLAPQKSPMQIVPPGHFRNPKAVLQVIPSVVAPPDLEFPKVYADRWGDPFAKWITDSGGPGGPNGFGPGRGNEIGKGDRGTGRPGQPQGAGQFAPTCAYCPNPTFTDEAIKQKYGGTVMLRVIVSTEGRAERIQVLKGVGLGLDERAAEAVRMWRFRPGRGPDGRATPMVVIIEVRFTQL